MGKLVNITVKDYVDQVYSNDDGMVIYNELIKQLSQMNEIKVSFKDINALNSSFVNSAFIELLNDYDFQFIKEHIHFTDSTKQINDIIKSRFLFELNERNKN